MSAPSSSTSSSQSRAMRLTTLLGAFALTLGANALHAEDAGKVDWHTKLLGIPLPDRPFVPNFHRVPPYRFGGSWKSVILTATESNTVGGLNPADSSIGESWVLDTHFGSLVAALSLGSE